jgi:uncharacterized membrane protein YjfL (UPF0719 family)
MSVTIIFLNFMYATIGAILTILFMIIGYKLFDHITPFKTSKQLEERNVAVGIVVGSIFIGLGIAIGLVIGHGLN